MSGSHLSKGWGRAWGAGLPSFGDCRNCTGPVTRRTRHWDCWLQQDGRWVRSPVNSQIHISHIFDCHPYTMTHFETTELLLDAFYFHRNNLSIQGEQLASPFRTVSSYIHFLHFPFHLSLCAISVAMHIPCQRRSYHFVILQDQGQGSATQQECGFWQNKPNLDLRSFVRSSCAKLYQ